MSYTAPVRDMRFVIEELAGLDELAKLPGLEEATPDLVAQILEESAKFCGEVLAPLNWPGDREGAVLEDGKVTTPKGFKEAYRQFAEAGWTALEGPAEYGGQGLPKIVGAPIIEMWKASNLSFALCPMLTAGAIEALVLRGSDEQKQTFLPKMVSGEWTGTMNLTEPQAGSDLAQVKTRAVREGNHYRLFGQKIFITYGEHDFADNIVHLVLARTPDAPPGVKGISLFIVPKFLVNADGSPGARNDVKCIKLEEKLGIHASPTCVMVYGDEGGAVGYLVGEENRGLEYMFIMMNAARFGVGMEGVGLADRAYQGAVAYAKERVQSRDVAGSAGPVTIIHHPDVRRMLMSMRAASEATRAVAYVVAAAMDRAHHHPDATERKKSQAFVDLMIPIVKGWSTEVAIEVASTGVQVHGGMGFVEETGAAQHLRDARITTIYEGTTGIQANDLIGRKIGREGGATAKAVIAEMKAVAAALAGSADADLKAIGARLEGGVAALADAVDWIVANFASDPKAVHAGAVPFLELMGIVSGGWQMGRAALMAHAKLASGDGDAAFYRAKIATARFFADHYLALAPGLKVTVAEGARGVLALAAEQF
ncbi:MAG: acyl-CoA dehydrogenase [Burkholderiales bacterium]|jgi:alkylation response protein AidB-like acyl-CoA dehydrogenase|nr:acyl-CoA dehydrogenase [Burkholderiales bacterium]